MTGTGLPSFNPNVLLGTTPRSATADLLANFQKQAQEQITKQQQAMAAPYEAEMAQHRRDYLKWLPVTQSIDSAQTRVNSAIAKLNMLNKTVTKMLHKVSTMDTTVDWTKVAREFDTLRTTLNSSAHSGAKENLIGSVRRSDTYAGNTITYQIDPNGTEMSIAGKYAGTDYDIRLSDGTFYRPSGAQTMQRYEAYPLGKSGYTESVSNGSISLDSTFDESDLDFTLGKNTAATTSHTNATLERHGLGVLQSWLYDGLSTTAGRTRAIEDLEAARDKLKVMTSKMEAHKIALGTYENRAKEHQNAAQAKIEEIQANAQVELQNYVYTAGQQARANAQVIAAGGDDNPGLQLLRSHSGKIGKLLDMTI